ncbi:MAG: hypothetical protein ACYSPI_03235, partial [Planctomycetota bacterium]
IVYDETYAEILRVGDIAFGGTVSADIDNIDFRTSSTFDGVAFLDDVRVRALADIEPALSVGSELTPVLTESWSTVTKTLTSNVGATIRWKVTASDTSGNTTTSETYSFTTVAPDLPPEIVMNSPEDNSWSASSSIAFSRPVPMMQT